MPVSFPEPARVLVSSSRDGFLSFLSRSLSQTERIAGSGNEMGSQKPRGKETKTMAVLDLFPYYKKMTGHYCVPAEERLDTGEAGVRDEITRKSDPACV